MPVVAEFTTTLNDRASIGLVALSRTLKQVADQSQVVTRTTREMTNQSEVMGQKLSLLAQNLGATTVKTGDFASMGGQGARAASRLSSELSTVALVASTAGGSLAQLGQTVVTITTVTGSLAGLAGAMKGLLALLAGAGGLVAASAVIGAGLGLVAGKFLATVPVVDRLTTTLAQYTASGKSAQVSQEALGLTTLQLAERQQRLTKVTEEGRIATVQLAAATTAAGSERAAAEAKASGDVLGVIATELAQKRAAIQLAVEAATTGSTERAVAEATALDKTVAAELAAVEQRKAAIRGFVSEAIGLAQSLGAGFEDLARKLQIVQALEQNAKALQTFAQLAQAGLITAQEFAAVQAELKARMDDLTRGILPAVAAVDALATSSLTAATALQTLGQTSMELTELELEISRLDQAMVDLGETGTTASTALQTGLTQTITVAEQLAVSLAQVEAGLTDLAGAVPSPGPGAGPIVSLPGSLRALGGARTFQLGGIVPGPSARAVPAILHGGEIVRTPAQEAALAAGGGGPPVTIVLQGTNVIESGRAIRNLSERMSNLITDSVRRRR